MQQPVLTLQTEIGDQNVFGILDTGSHVTFISQNFWNKLTFFSNPGKRIFKPKDHWIQVSSDNAGFQTKKIENVTLCIENLVFQLDLHIVDNIIEDLILGIDFMFQTDLIIDYQQEIASVKGKIVKLIPLKT